MCSSDLPTEALPTWWSELAGLGWLGLHIPEAHGGSGYGLEELVVVVEQMGRAVAPGPFVPTVIASATLASVGGDVAAAHLPGLADGSTVGAISLNGSATVSGNTISGDGGTVLGGGLATLLLIGVGNDIAVVQVGDGVSLTVPPNMDPTRRAARLTLDKAPCVVLPEIGRAHV